MSTITFRAWATRHPPWSPRDRCDGACRPRTGGTAGHRVDDQWQSLGLGEKQSHDFPAGTYRFLVNILDGLGVCQMHSVYSPMRDFPNQASAVAAARDFLERLMAPAPAVDGEVPVDEELLGRILRGEDIPEIDTALASAALEPVSP